MQVQSKQKSPAWLRCETITPVEIRFSRKSQLIFVSPKAAVRVGSFVLFCHFWQNWNLHAGLFLRVFNDRRERGRGTFCGFREGQTSAQNLPGNLHVLCLPTNVCRKPKTTRQHAIFQDTSTKFSPLRLQLETTKLFHFAIMNDPSPRTLCFCYRKLSHRRSKDSSLPPGNFLRQSALNCPLRPNRALPSSGLSPRP